jgi:hypothetical protein
METQQTPDALFNAYLDAQTDAQKKKALKEIENDGGQTAVNMALWLDSIDLKGGK